MTTLATLATLTSDKNALSFEPACVTAQRELKEVKEKRQHLADENEMTHESFFLIFTV